MPTQAHSYNLWSLVGKKVTGTKKKSKVGISYNKYDWTYYSNAYWDPSINHIWGLIIPALKVHVTQP